MSSPPVPRTALVALCATQFVLVLDVAVVNVAVVPLAADLGADPGRLQVLGWSYAAAFGGLLLPAGRVADRGRRRAAVVGGLVLFAAASALCGAAPSVPALVAGRVLQGAGAALASPAALALLTGLYDDARRRAGALAVWSAVAAAGGAAGLVAGGVLTTHLGWRSVFWVNVPVVAAVVAAARVLPADPRDRRVPPPLLPRVLRRSRPVRLANAVTALISAAVIGTNFFLAVHLQQRLGLPALAAGLAFLPMTAVSAASAAWAARAVPAAGVGRLLAAGAAVTGAGCGWLALLPGDGSYPARVLPGMVLVAAGLGPGFALGTLAAVTGVPRRAHGAAAALLAVSTQAGAAAGLAGLEAVAAAAGGGPAGLRCAFAAMAAGCAVAAGLAARLPAGTPDHPNVTPPAPIPERTPR